MYYDDIVIGLGSMGSSTVYQLAKRGRRTLGIDAGKAGTSRSFADGGARIVRTAIGDEGAYTPFARRSDAVLDDLERESSLRMRMKTGGLLVRTSGTGSEVFEREAASARAHGIEYQWLETRDIRRRFSTLRPQSGEIGYYEPSSGYVRPGYVISVQLGLAGLAGAEIRRGERALAFRECSNGVSVETEKGTYRAERLILCVGAWTADLLGEAFAERRMMRHETVYCFGVADERPFLPKNFPVFMWEQPNSYRKIQGFPAIDGFRGGMKFAVERDGLSEAPTELGRPLSREEASAMHEQCIAPRFLGVTSRVLKAWTSTCLAPSSAGLAIDRHPASQAIMVVTSGAGCGSRYAPAVGEAIAQISAGGRSQLDLMSFRSEHPRDSVAFA